MAEKYVLYEHRNKTNGKRYIGITKHLPTRWAAQGSHYKGSPKFWAAIKKYGWDNFSHTVLLKNLTADQANRLEIHFIAKYQTQDKRFGYNCLPGGIHSPGMLGKKHTEEARRKMRKAALGRVVSKEQRRKQSERMKGLMVGKLNYKSTAVRCINTGEVFESQCIAAKEKGVLQSKISLCCKGKQYQTHGLRWEYVDEED